MCLNLCPFLGAFRFAKMPVRAAARGFAPGRSSADISGSKIRIRIKGETRDDHDRAQSGKQLASKPANKLGGRRNILIYVNVRL